MISDCKYDKIKILHELSSLVWFIDKCGLEDAQKKGEATCCDLFKALRDDLEKHITEIDNAIKKCD